MVRVPPSSSATALTGQQPLHCRRVAYVMLHGCVALVSLIVVENRAGGQNACHADVLANAQADALRGGSVAYGCNHPCEWEQCCLRTGTRPKALQSLTHWAGRLIELSGTYRRLAIHCACAVHLSVLLKQHTQGWTDAANSRLGALRAGSSCCVGTVASVLLCGYLVGSSLRWACAPMLHRCCCVCVREFAAYP